MKPFLKLDNTSHHILGNDEMETRKTTALTTVITGLRKFTNYSLQVLAFTKVGDGVHTATIYCQTDEDGKSFLLFFTNLSSTFCISQFLVRQPILKL